MARFEMSLRMLCASESSCDLRWRGLAPRFSKVYCGGIRPPITKALYLPSAICRLVLLALNTVNVE